jgi:hypothetical protein
VASGTTGTGTADKLTGTDKPARIRKKKISASSGVTVSGPAPVKAARGRKKHGV